VIVISGALVLIALVLLILGIAVNIVFVYAAIGVAIVSAAFLLFGVLQAPSHAHGADDDEDDSAKGKARAVKGRKDDDDDRDDKDAEDGKAEKAEKAEKAQKAQKAEKVKKDKRTAAAAGDEHDADDTDDDETDHEVERAGRGKQAAAGVAAAGAGAAAAAAMHHRGHDDDADDEGAEAGPRHDTGYDQDDLPEEQVPDGAVAAAQQSGENVFVVSGHPRFHAQRCPAVGSDDDIEDIDLLEAIELGFTPCGVCRPLATLGGEQPAASPVSPPSPASPPAAAAPPPPPADSQPAAAVLTPSRSFVSQPVSVNGSSSDGSFAPDGQTTQLAPVYVSPAASPAPAPPPAPPVEAQPEQQLPQPTGAVRAGSSAAAAPRTTSNPRSVLVAAGEYHRPGCERLEGQDAEEKPKVAAIRSGSLACAVCRP